jgi:hypothetical protein
MKQPEHLDAGDPTRRGSRLSFDHADKTTFCTSSNWPYTARRLSTTKTENQEH